MIAFDRPLPDDRTQRPNPAADRTVELAGTPTPDLEESSVKKAIVVYRSHSGVTRRYGEEIAAYLSSKGVAAQVVSVGECDMSTLNGVDYLFLGCWTAGLFLIGQHPDEPWLAFVRAMPKLTWPEPKVVLFTTYKLRTGSQFEKMRVALKGKTPAPELELKSKDGRLSPKDDGALDLLIA